MQSYEKARTQVSVRALYPGMNWLAGMEKGQGDVAPCPWMFHPR